MSRAPCPRNWDRQCCCCALLEQKQARSARSQGKPADVSVSTSGCSALHAWCSAASIADSSRPPGRLLRAGQVASKAEAASAATRRPTSTPSAPTTKKVGAQHARPAGARAMKDYDPGGIAVRPRRLLLAVVHAPAKAWSSMATWLQQPVPRWPRGDQRRFRCWASVFICNRLPTLFDLHCLLGPAQHLTPENQVQFSGNNSCWLHCSC